MKYTHMHEVPMDILIDYTLYIYTPDYRQLPHITVAPSVPDTRRGLSSASGRGARPISGEGREAALKKWEFANNRGGAL